MSMKHSAETSNIFDWKIACENDERLKSYLMATVVRDEFNPRQPDQDDVAIARKHLSTSEQTGQPNPFVGDGNRILPSAPDGLRL